MTYTLARHPYPPAVRSMRLAERSTLAGGFVRVRLVEAVPGELAGFVAPGAGDHVRVLVGSADGGAVTTVEQGAPYRTETVVAHDAAAGWIDLDILDHDGHGVIGPWATHAPLGSPALVAGPKGSVVITGRPEQWVIAGDDSAIPAMRRYLALLHGRGEGMLVLETAADLGPKELTALGLDGLEARGRVEVSIHRPQSGAPGAALVTALETLPAPGDPLERFVFACAEQSIVAPVRSLLARWGIDVERAVVKGYWRRADTEQ